MCGLVPCIAAFKDAGLEVNCENAERSGVAIGSGIGGLGMSDSTSVTFDESGPRRVSPFFIP